MKKNDILSAIVGSTFFAIPYLALSMPVLPSVLIGSAAFVAGELVFKKTSTDEFDIESGNFKRTIEKAKKRSKHIKDMMGCIDDEFIKNNLSEIHESVNSIISTIERNPQKVKNVNNFFDYYLPITIKIIDRYNEIEDRKISSEDSKKFIKSTNKMVEDINYAFKKILNKLYEKDIIGDYAEMKVFDSMLKMDGYDSGEINVKEDNDG